MATRIILLLLVCIHAVAQITNVSIGSNPNDGAGDTLRTAFSKVNTNVAWLAGQLGSATNSPNFTTNATVAGADVATKVNTIAALRLLSPKTDRMLVDVLGYYISGDGGGGQFFIDASDTSTTDDGGSVIACANGYRAKAIFGKDNIPALRFGVKADFSIFSWSGTDNTARLQAAIDYSESSASNGVVPVILPQGTIGINSITLKYASLKGVGSNLSFPYRNTVLAHISGATNDMIVMDVVSGGSYVQVGTFNGVEDLMLVGSRERNLKNPKTILSASSRNSFTVSTNDVPPTPSDASGFPFFGFCYFFSSENRFLGHGVVQSVNTNTGAITIASGWDNYATESGAGGLLSSGFKVCFAGIGTLGEYQTNRSDSTAAGYSAITVIGSGFKKFRNLNILSFHCGIRAGNSIVLQSENVWGLSLTHSLFSSVWLDTGADDSHYRMFNQGQYLADQGLPAESLTIIDTGYRRCAFGMYGLRSRTQISKFTSDGCVYGILHYGNYQQTLNQTLIDYATKAAFISILASGRSVGLQLNDFQITAARGTLPTYITYNGSGAREAVIALGQARESSLDFSTFQSVLLPGESTNNNWEALFYATGNATVNVGSLIPGTGYNAISVAGAYPSIGSVSSGITNISTARWGVFRTADTTTEIAANGSSGLKVSAASVGATPTVGIRNPPTILGHVDTMGRELTFGTDLSSSASRTDNAGKSARFSLPGYTFSQGNMAIVAGTSDLANNSVQYGGAVSTWQSATLHQFYAASSVGTLNGTEVARMSIGGLVVQPSGVSANIDASLLWEPRSTTKGALVGPKMTTAQSDAIASPVSGLGVYDTTVNKHRVHDGTMFRYGEMYLPGSVTWDIPSTSAGGEQTTTVAITGATVGDIVLVTPSRIAQSFLVSGVVQTNGVVSLYGVNCSTGTIDPASQTYTVHVLKP